MGKVVSVGGYLCRRATDWPERRATFMRDGRPSLLRAVALLCWPGGFILLRADGAPHCVNYFLGKSKGISLATPIGRIYRRPTGTGIGA